jgi:hypothetical protein
MAHKPSFKFKNGRLICNNKSIHLSVKKSSSRKLKDILNECGVK